jgi:4-hydroxy-tetrahydrodipicolinate reductase
MLKVAISGSSGRMGRAVKDLIAQSEGRFSYCAGLAGSPNDKQSVSDISKWNPSEIDVVVDFSLPESFDAVFKWCADNQKPMVSGTTGFVVSDFEEKAKSFPFMHSGNYSLGVAGLIKSISAFKKMSPNAEVWIEDYHHTKKLDSPSGTAVKIMKRIESDLLKKEVEVKAVRAGSIFGVHNVHIATDQEWVTLTHRALNRGVFAEGALNAVEWLAGQKAGAYTFEDFLGF